MPLPNNNNMSSDLDAISADSASDVWIVGTYLFEVNPSDYSQETYSLHWNGSAWSIVPMPLNPGTNPNVGTRSTRSRRTARPTCGRLANSTT